MRFTIAAVSAFAATALAVANPDVTVTEYDWVTVTSCAPEHSTDCPVYSHKPTAPAYVTLTSTTPCPIASPTPKYTPTYEAPVHSPTYEAPVHTPTYEAPVHTPTYVAPAPPTTTPCNSTTAAPTPVYSTYWTYVCPNPEICHASSTVVPVAPSTTGGYAPPYYPSVTTPAAPQYTGAASSINMAAGLAFGLVSFAAVFLA